MNINAKNRQNQTALYQAIFWGELEIAEYLLKMGADPYITFTFMSWSKDASTFGGLVKKDGNAFDYMESIMNSIKSGHTMSMRDDNKGYISEMLKIKGILDKYKRKS